MEWKSVWLADTGWMPGHWNNFSSFKVSNGRFEIERDSSDEYSMSYTETQKLLLRQLCAVDTQDKAQEFFRNWGPPVTFAKPTTVREILSYAQSLRWVVGMISAAQNNDIATLARFVRYGKRRNGMHAWLIPPGKIYGRLHNTHPDSRRPMKLNAIEPELLRFACDVIRWEDEYYLEAVNGLLEIVFTRALHGVVPQVSSGKYWREHESSLVPLCPWQAAHLALYNGWQALNPLKSCANPNCSNTFEKSRDKVYCGRDACRKWCSRNLGLRFRSYKRT